MQNKRRWLIPASFLIFSILLWGALHFIYLEKYIVATLEPGANEIFYMSPIKSPSMFFAALTLIEKITFAVSILVILTAWIRPIALITTAIFAFGAIVYAFSAMPAITEQSGAPHYVYLADSFLHGNLVLAEEPPNSEENDWTFHEGEWSVSFPPAPALLMMPFVAVWGLDFNDVIFTFLFGAFNLTLAYQLFSKINQESAQSVESVDKSALFLTTAFGFGTVHWWLSTNGQVWFTAHIIATTFLLLSLNEIFAKRRPAWVAFWLGVSALARPTVLFALPALIWFLHPQKTWKEIAKGAIPLFVIGALMASYNYLRYDNPFELGYSYMALENLLAKRVEEFGSFNLIFFKENFYHAFLNFGEWRTTFPYLIMDGWGLSIFLSTPLLVYAFFAPWREKKVRVFALAALLVALPNLLYYNTGYLQAGYRYALDFLPFLFLLVAFAWHGRTPLFGKILTGLSMITGFLMWVNFTGMAWELF